MRKGVQSLGAQRAAAQKSGGDLWGDQERGTRRDRPAIPDRPRYDGIHRADRYRRNRHHPDRRRHLRLLQRELQLRHLRTEPLPDSPNRPAAPLHLHTPAGRKQHRRHGAGGSFQKRGSGKNGGGQLEAILLRGGRPWKA